MITLIFSAFLFSWDGRLWVCLEASLKPVSRFQIVPTEQSAVLNVVLSQFCGRIRDGGTEHLRLKNLSKSIPPSLNDFVEILCLKPIAFSFHLIVHVDYFVVI